MAEAPFARALSAAVPDPAAPDADLLRRFAGAGDGPAFELVVRRHAGLVWAVCRGVLPADAHAAEDAFQATFLALARKAAAVRGPSAAGWLARVARHAALRARAARKAEPLPADLPAPPAAPGDSAEVAAVVAEEVGRLLARFREPVLLCFFEGCSHAEAAARLGLPAGTVASRVARAKDRLRARLARRGLGLPAAVAAVAPPAAARAAVGTALGPPAGVPPAVHALATGALAAMSPLKPRLLTAAGLLLAAGAVAVAVAQGPPPVPPNPPPPAAKPAPADPVAEELKVLAGTWRVARIENQRGEAPPAVLEPMRWVIAGDEVSATDTGDPADRKKGRVKVDPGTAPKRIDLTMPAGPGAGQITAPGIYELTADTLTVCAGEKDRPADLKPGPDASVIVLTRAGTPAAVLARLEGAWAVTGLDVDGKPALEADRKLARAVFYRDVLWLLVPAEGGGDDKYRVGVPDPTRPREVDLLPVAGPRAVFHRQRQEPVKPLPALLELKGNALTLCLPGGRHGDAPARPADLKAGPGVTLLTLTKLGTADGP